MLVLLVGGVLVGDRLAARAAEGLLEDAVRQSAPDARVDADLDVPFLPQFLRGRYDEVRVDLSGPLEGVTVQEATVTLTGAEVAPRDALSGAITRVPVRAARVRAVLGYDELTRLAGDGLAVSSAGDGLVRVTGTVEVLGQELSAAAVAQVTVVDGRLVVRPQRFETGASLADGLLERVAGDRFSFPVDPGPLPFGLTPTAVVPGPDGVVLTAQTGPTVLDTGSVSSGRVRTGGALPRR